MALKNDLIKLANDNPELRKHLLPILKEASNYLIVRQGYRDLVELRLTPEFDMRMDWGVFRKSGDKGNKELKSSAKKLIQCIKKQCGKDYKVDRENVSIKPFYLSCNIGPVNEPAELSDLKKSVKACGLKFT